MCVCMLVWVCVCVCLFVRVGCVSTFEKPNKAPSPKRGEPLPCQCSALRDDGATDGHRHFGRACEPQAALRGVIGFPDSC